MTNTKSMTAGYWLLAFACGAAAGAAAGIMTAPRSGKETREKVQGWARKMSRKARRVPTMLSETAERVAHAGKETFTDTYRTVPRTNI